MMATEDMASSQPSIEILQSWGVASARIASGGPVPSGELLSSNATEYLYDVPLGAVLVRWDLLSRKRVLQFQAHSDLVIGARRSPDGTFIASSAYSGGVKLWSEKWVCQDSTQAPMQSQFHLSWSHDSKRFLVLGNGKLSSIVIYDICEDSSSHKLKQTLHLPAQGLPTPSNLAGSCLEKDCQVQNQELSIPEQNEVELSGLNYPYEEAFFMAEFNPNGKIFAVKELPYKTTLLYLLSADGCVEKMADLMAMVGQKDYSRRPVNTIFMTTHHDGLYAVGVEGGDIAVVDAEQLNINTVLKAGSGFRAGIWDGQCLVVHSDSGKMMWWDRTSGEKLLEFDTLFDDIVVHLDWSVSGNGVWLCGFSRLAYCTVERRDGSVVAVEPSHSVTCHEITSVGVTFDPTGSLLASGDMVGNVWITQKDQVDPLYKFSVGGSVRCMAWLDEESLLVGTLDGAVQAWDVGDSQPRSLLQFQGSVIHIRFNHKHKVLAIGTSQGMLLVYEMVKVRPKDIKCSVVVEVRAHPPQPGKQDQRFGQLTKQAEIWSLCWSPNDTKLATCSEDQTVKVWDTVSWKWFVSLFFEAGPCLNTHSQSILRGHKLAVTSVDWTQRGSLSLLVSCSDDRTVRLVNGETYELLTVVDTKDIYGWHTLTYLTFYPHKKWCLLLCTTQNGHLVVWQVLETAEGEDRGHKDKMLKRLWKGKLHLGSVEGLAWHHQAGTGQDGSIATVGADCIVNIFNIVL